jgi:hypothetical protein
MPFSGEDAMKILARNRTRNSGIALASLFAFLFFVGSSPFALAAENWPTWPPKKETPAATESPNGKIKEGPAQEKAPAAPASSAPAAPAAKAAGAAGGKKAAAGISSGTLGWAAAIVGGGILIGVAAGGGGGSSSNH